MNDLIGKTALVTGASRGIGQAILLALGRAGASVVGTATSQQGADGITKLLKEKGIKVTSIMPGATWSASWAGVELPESRLMQANDIAIATWSAYQMSPSAVVEDIVVRPQLGDL